MGGGFPNTADFGSPRGTTVDDAETTRGVAQEWDVDEEDEGFATMSQLQHQQPTFPAEEELSLGRSRPGKIINDPVHGHMGAHSFCIFHPKYGAQSLVTRNLFLLTSNNTHVSSRCDRTLGNPTCLHPLLPQTSLLVLNNALYFLMYSRNNFSASEILTFMRVVTVGSTPVFSGHCG